MVISKLIYLLCVK